jgi:hypothetical protein
MQAAPIIADVDMWKTERGAKGGGADEQGLGA